MQYSIDELVRVARRDNNRIRPYLYVNPKQGKHIPTDPKDFMSICKSLASKVNIQYPTDRLYVIGFAETATGIASGVSRFLDNVVYYQNTTREKKEDAEYLHFTESHSHATDQMLRSTEIEERIKSIDRILIIDDEVTTGNTIQKLVNTIRCKYNTKNQFTIVSVLNSMPNERIKALGKEGIDCIFLLDLPYEYKKDQIKEIVFDDNNNTVAYSDEDNTIDTIVFDSVVNVRFISDFKSYDSETAKFTEYMIGFLKDRHYNNALVLGTEEFMYPTCYFGEELLKRGIVDSVKVQATTRSPIIASEEKGYPLFHRYQIRSPYDENRITYIYNLKQYEKVFIMTDAGEGFAGINDLIQALKSVGNSDITLIRWCYKSLTTCEYEQ